MLCEDLADCEGSEKISKRERKAFARPSVIPMRASWNLLEGFVGRS